MQPMFHNCNTNKAEKKIREKNKKERKKKKTIRYGEFQGHLLTQMAKRLCLVS